MLADFLKANPKLAAAEGLEYQAVQIALDKARVLLAERKDKTKPPEKLSPVQTLQTEKLARTMTLDPVTHLIYLATADEKPIRSPAPSHAPRHQSATRGTFRVLVYGPEK